MINQWNKYMVLSLSKILDSTPNNKHLAGSVFFTNRINLKNWKNYENNSNIIFVIHIEYKAYEEYHFISICDNLYLLKMSLLSFIVWCFDQNLDLEKFLINLLKEAIEDDKEVNAQNLKQILQLKSILNNIIFVFDNFDWFNLQLLFKILKIEISGGTITKRYLLTTSQFKLSKFLYNLGYNDEDIYFSFKYLKNLSKSNHNIPIHLKSIFPGYSYLELKNILNVEEELMPQNLPIVGPEYKQKFILNILLENYSEKIEDLNGIIKIKKEELNNQKNKLNDYTSELKTLEMDLTKMAVASTSIPIELCEDSSLMDVNKITTVDETLNFNTNKRISKLNHKINLLLKSIKYIEFEKGELESKVSDLNKERDTFNTLSIDELQKKYLVEIYKFKLDQDITKFKNNLLKLNKINKKNRKKESYFSFSPSSLVTKNYIPENKKYSTLSISNFKTINLSNNSKAYLDINPQYNFKFKIFKLLKKNYTSIFNDSIFADNLKKFIYSENSKEKIQKNIENYLISNQNILILNQIQRSSESNLNYKILNPNVNKILLESSTELEKLYNNFIFEANKNLSDVLILNNEPEKLKLESNSFVKVDESFKKETSKQKKIKLIVKIFSIVGFEFILNIMLGRLFKIISCVTTNRLSNYFTDAAYDLGLDVINRYNYNLFISITKQQPDFKKSEFTSFSLFKFKNKEKIISTDDLTLIVEIGSVLLAFLIEIKLLTYKVELLNKNEKKRILYPGSIINKFIPNLGLNNSLKLNIDMVKDSVNNKVIPIFNLPKKLPMIVPPKNYLSGEGKIQLGGYLLNDVLYTEPLFIENYDLVEKSEVLKENIIYKMVDNINSVSFSINHEVLDFILKNYKKYNLIIDPFYTHPLELKSKLTVVEIRELESFNSRKKLEMDIINLALIYKNCLEIYLPVRLDYRGRLYCIVEYLNYQGIELAKALLKFSKGEKVYLKNELSIKYLKIFGANCFGKILSKKSFADRIDWVDNNVNNIINFENGELLLKAENKLLFIAFCFEYKNYLLALNKKADFFITHLPIQLDATCNGFQHLSLLLEDVNLAKQVNLNNSSWEDAPEDLYLFLTIKSKEYIESELALNKLGDKMLESYNRLSKIDFQNHRNLVKKTIMTIPYNASTYTNILDMKVEFKMIIKNNEKFYIYNKDNSIILKDIDFLNICKILDYCLNKHFSKLEGLLNYFKEIAKISALLGVSIPWSLPSGLNVKQQYYGSKTIKLKPFIYTKDLLNLKVQNKSVFNKRKQSNALMPNLVHSLDSASLALLIDNFFKIENNYNFYSIHDCFAVTCNKVDLMIKLLKLSYYTIYCNEPFLKKFDSNFKNFILIQFGENSFLKENTIQITNQEGNLIKIKYPDINQVLKPTLLEFMESSYPIN
jgi:DNA-directed RNA polymerase